VAQIVRRTTSGVIDATTCERGSVVGWSLVPSIAARTPTTTRPPLNRKYSCLRALMGWAEASEYIVRTTGHGSVAVLGRYVRTAIVFERNAAASVGL
jgi:hypothetical protein